MCACPLAPPSHPSHPPAVAHSQHQPRQLPTCHSPQSSACALPRRLRPHRPTASPPAPHLHNPPSSACSVPWRLLPHRLAQRPGPISPADHPALLSVRTVGREVCCATSWHSPFSPFLDVERSLPFLNWRGPSAGYGECSCCVEELIFFLPAVSSSTLVLSRGGASQISRSHSPTQTLWPPSHGPTERTGGPHTAGLVAPATFSQPYCLTVAPGPPPDRPLPPHRPTATPNAPRRSRGPLPPLRHQPSSARPLASAAWRLTSARPTGAPAHLLLCAPARARLHTCRRAQPPVPAYFHQLPSIQRPPTFILSPARSKHWPPSAHLARLRPLDPPCATCARSPALVARAYSQSPLSVSRLHLPASASPAVQRQPTCPSSPPPHPGPLPTHCDHQPRLPSLV